MYVITDKQGVIIKMSPTIDYQENGNPLVDNGQLAIAEILVGAVSGDVDVPDGVGEYTHKWIDGKFSVNEDYVPPSGSLIPKGTDELAAQVADLTQSLNILMGGMDNEL